MLTVPAGYQDAIKADGRQIFGRVIIDYTDPFIDQSITVTANEKGNASFPGQTANSIQEPAYKYAALDGTWLLDGSYALAPADGKYEMGWWGASLAGVGGAFSVPYPKLTMEFFSRPIQSLKVVGDSLRGEYPIDFEIKLYNVADTVLYTETVTGNTEVVWTTPIIPVTQVVKMTLEITKWSHAGRVVKILEFFTSVQETYEGDDIISVNLLEERDVSQGSLPIGNISANEIDIKLNNTSHKFDAGNTQSPLYELLKPNRRVRAWLGIEVED